MPSQFENLRKAFKAQEIQVQTTNWPQDNMYSLFIYEGHFGDHDLNDRMKARATEIATTIPGTKVTGGAKSGGFTIVFNNEAARVEMLKALDACIDQLITPEAEKEDPAIKNWPFNPGWN